MSCLRATLFHKGPSWLGFVLALTLSIGWAQTTTGDSRGVTKDTINLGVLVPLTGPFAPGAKPQVLGLQLFWDEVNRTGGVCNGRSVKLMIRDNGYSAQKSLVAFSEIVDSIVAVQLTSGSPPTLAIKSQLQDLSMVAIPGTWSPDLLGSPSILIPGTTYDVDMYNAVKFLVGNDTLKRGSRIAYIFLQGDFGRPGFEGAQAAANEAGIDVDRYQIEPSSADLSPQITQILSKKSNAVFMSVTQGQVAAAAALMESRGARLPIVVPTPSFAPEQLTSAAGQAIANSVFVTSPFNTWTGDGSELVRLRNLYGAYAKDGGTIVPQQYVIFGFTVAKLLHSALVEACSRGPLTRQALSAVFRDSKEFKTEGLSSDMTFAERQRSPALGNYIAHADRSVPGGLKSISASPFVAGTINRYLKQHQSPKK